MHWISHIIAVPSGKSRKTWTRSSRDRKQMCSVTRSLHGILTKLPRTRTGASTAAKSFASNSSAAEESKLRRAVKKFKQSCEDPSFRHDKATYRVTVRRLAAAKKFSVIEEILEQQKKYGDIRCEGFAARLIHLYGQSGMFEHARKLFDELPELNCERGIMSFNALLKAALDAKKFASVVEVFKQLPSEVSIEPDLISYNIVIHAFCEMGWLDSAMSMIDEMGKKGLKPDVISFNTLLNGFYRKGRFVDGERLWGLLEKKYPILDIRSYNAKLHGLALAKKTKEAADLVGEMRAKGIEPDVFSFNLVIKGFVEEKNLDGAKQWYAEMRKRECTPNKTTFEMLITFLRKQGDLELAFELSKEVFARRFLLGEALLQRVVDELVKASKVDEARTLVELGKNNNYRWYRLKLPSPE